MGCYVDVFKGIHILEKTLEASPSAATTAEPYLFNLCALFMGTYFRVQYQFFFPLSYVGSHDV